MEGPTPVSSLIHAATMVTAGVYLIARTHILFELAPTAGDISAVDRRRDAVVRGVGRAGRDRPQADRSPTRRSSQIGYMMMGVSIAAYSAGMFHLMTHAFFKALLFMGAGSVIARDGRRPGHRPMGGFRKAMPFTFVTFIDRRAGAAAFPLTSGFFSKDDILALRAAAAAAATRCSRVVGTSPPSSPRSTRSGWCSGSSSASPCPRRASSRTGHLAHGEPVNPATGEPEDTDVGFPGPEHHIAEREWPMQLAMALLAVLAVVGGVHRHPRRRRRAREVPRARLRRRAPGAPTSPATATDGLGAGRRRHCRLVGIALAWFIYIARPGRRCA